MILDVARHKLYEGFLTLFVISCAALVSNEGMASEVAPTAPLGKLLNDFALQNNVLAVIVAMLCIVGAATSLARATIRCGIYTISTLAAMSLTGLLIAAATHHAGMLVSLVVAMLAAESVARMLRSLKGSNREHYTFTAMLATGCLPLFDSALMVVVFVALFVGTLAAHSARHAIIAYVGVLLPLVGYCYVMWCCGEGFVASAAMLWNNMLLPATQPLNEVISTYHFIFAGILLCVALLALVCRHTQPVAVQHTTRRSWDIMFAACVVLSLALVLLPSTSAVSPIVVGMVIMPMLPLFFQRMPTLLSLIVYVTMLVDVVFILLQ